MANFSLYSYMYFSVFILAPLLRQTKVETTGTKMEGNTRRSLEHVHVHVSVRSPVLGVNRKNSCTCILKRGWLCALKHILYLPYVDNIVVFDESSLLCWLPLCYSWYPCDFERNLVLSFIEHPQAEELGRADTTALHTRIQD